MKKIMHIFLFFFSFQSIIGGTNDLEIFSSAVTSTSIVVTYVPSAIVAGFSEIAGIYDNAFDEFNHSYSAFLDSSSGMDVVYNMDLGEEDKILAGQLFKDDYLARNNLGKQDTIRLIRTKPGVLLTHEDKLLMLVIFEEKYADITMKDKRI